MPIVLPGSVSAEPLDEERVRICSPSSRPGSTRPKDLARPQSTTRVSPYLPTMMFPGLTSRCSTPRLCAYSMVLQTSRNRRNNPQFQFPVLAVGSHIRVVLVRRGVGRQDRRRVGTGHAVAPTTGAWNRSIASLRLPPLMNRIA